MKYRVLFVIPWFFGLAHLLGYFYWSDRSWYQDFVHWEIIAFKSLSFFGFLVAALKFRRGDYLRWAWLFMAGCLLMYTISDLFFYSYMPGLIGEGPALKLRGVVLVLGNLCFIISVWMLARTWHAAGLEFPGSKWNKWLMTIGVILLSMAMAGPASMRGLVEVLQDRYDTWSVINTIGGLGDIVALSLIAPMLMTALALQGGMLQWPWMFLTAILVSWLGFDAVFSWGPILGLSQLTRQCVYETFRVLACMYGVSAGLAQLFILEEIKVPSAFSTTV